MRLPKAFFWLASSVVAPAALSAPTTPTQLLHEYQMQAHRENSAYTSSAGLGAHFYAQAFRRSDVMPSCSSCHTENPRNAGQHAITGKAIKPLSPHANPERFTDPAKVEKWFGRNCKEVVGRPCTSAEKADFMTYLLQR